MFYSIGYSLTSLPNFIKVLKDRDIATLVDVRTIPRSRVKYFNKAYLRDSLIHHGISYIHDPRLGGKTGERGPEYAKALHSLQVMEYPDEHINIAFMCLERKPEECHRGQWITPDLMKLGETVEHLFPLPRGEEVTNHNQAGFHLIAREYDNQST